jgi:hypothetical protein
MNSHVAGQLSRNVGKVIDEARNEPYVSEIAFDVHPGRRTSRGSAWNHH